MREKKALVYMIYNKIKMTQNKKKTYPIGSCLMLLFMHLVDQTVNLDFNP